MNDTILLADNIKKFYRVAAGKLDVLKGVSLELKRGDFTFVVGRSGSGKSTLLHILGGLDAPSQGSVFIEGKNMNNFSANKMADFRNRKVAFVFQFYYLLPELTVIENVMLPGLIGHVKKKNLRAKAFDLLKAFGIEARYKHIPRQLSGGELQRAAIARALINEPDIVFCDEPTGNLDEMNSKLIFELLQELNYKKNQTFCIVTHEENFIDQIKKVYRLKDGVLV